MIRDNRFIIKPNAEKFKNYLIGYGSILINKPFIVDESNSDTLNELYYYMTCNKAFKGDLNKGLILIGGFGTGKTTISRVLAQMFKDAQRKYFDFISGIELTEKVRDKHYLEYYAKRPLIIDEIGRGAKSVKDYGTERHPFEELISVRYINKAMTIGTSNYTFEDLNDIYGMYLSDRLKEMFNFIKLTGKSRRG